MNWIFAVCVLVFMGLVLYFECFDDDWRDYRDDEDDEHWDEWR